MNRPLKVDLLADLGKAKGCSSNTLVTNSVVKAILLKGWNLHIDEASAVVGLQSTGLHRLVLGTLQG